MKHAIIAAAQGHDVALESIRNWYVKGFVTKEQFCESRLAHQAAVDATRSQHRDAAPAYKKLFK
jgi:hypothetical protein